MAEQERKTEVYFDGNTYIVRFAVHCEDRRCVECRNVSPYQRCEALEIENEETGNLVPKGTHFSRIQEHLQDSHDEELLGDDESAFVYADQCRKCGYSYLRQKAELRISLQREEVTERLDSEFEEKIRETEREDW